MPEVSDVRGDCESIEGVASLRGEEVMGLREMLEVAAEVGGRAELSLRLV